MKTQSLEEGKQGDSLEKWHVLDRVHGHIEDLQIEFCSTVQAVEISNKFAKLISAAISMCEMSQKTIIFTSCFNEKRNNYLFIKKKNI